MAAGYMPFLLLYQQEIGFSFYRTYQSANEEVYWYALFSFILIFSWVYWLLHNPVFVYLMCRGSVHHSTIHKEKSNKMQQCIKILLFHIYMKLNMFRATHHPSSGA